MPTAASDCLFRPKEVRSEQREHKKYNDPGEKGVMLSQKPQSQKHASNQAVPTPGRFSTFPYMKQWTYGLESRARKAAFLHVLCPSLVFREIRAAALGLPVHFPVWDREDRGGWSCALGGSRPGSDSHAGEPLGRASRIFGLERVPSRNTASDSAAAASLARVGGLAVCCAVREGASLPRATAVAPSRGASCSCAARSKGRKEGGAPNISPLEGRRTEPWNLWPRSLEP